MFDAVIFPVATINVLKILFKRRFNALSELEQKIKNTKSIPQLT